ncbi:hypothetical protein MP638_006083 [Amoeboaphelidium occidentale]|nr:hypothetical protein MP638_006083 [Amoeboaphelidium occidentale]
MESPTNTRFSYPSSPAANIISPNLEHLNEIDDARSVKSMEIPRVLDQFENQAPASFSLVKSFTDFYHKEVGSKAFAATEDFEVQKERIENFLQIPWQLERFMFYGYLICLDTFLSIFAILPLRVLINLYSVSVRSAGVRLKKSDMMKLVLLGAGVYIMGLFDASRLYHSIRGQSVLKLYVIFNVLEIADRLCTSFGSDILESLFLRYSLDADGQESLSQMSTIKHFVLGTIYLVVHSMVLFYQVITLNVAVNSHNNALLTLLVSNQFVEIKGSVFKKFDGSQLFKIGCSDVVERFRLSVFMFLITLRNIIELGYGYWPENGFDIQFLGDMTFKGSFINFVTGLPWIVIKVLTVNIPNGLYAFMIQPFSYALDFGSYKSIFDALVYPIIIIMLTEVFVDWLKHAFITRFNGFNPYVYGHFLLELAKEYYFESNTTSELAFRRLEFPSMPIACVLLRITIQTISMTSILDCSSTASIFYYALKFFLLLVSIWASLLAAKFLLYIFLQLISSRFLNNINKEQHHDNAARNNFRSPKLPGRLSRAQGANESNKKDGNMKQYVSQPSDASIHSFML